MWLSAALPAPSLPFPSRLRCVFTLSCCFSGALSSPVTTERLSSACLRSPMCCYGENFSLAGMSSFFDLLHRGQGPQKSLYGRCIPRSHPDKCLS